MVSVLVIKQMATAVLMLRLLALLSHHLNVRGDSSPLPLYELQS